MAQQPVFEYMCTMRRVDGSTYDATLAALDDNHAMTEAAYEFEGKCIAVKRGEYLYDND